MKKLALKDIDVKGKRVLMRVDFNVPLEAGEITDNSRITKALPSINYILENGGKVILISHLGRPKGRRTKSLSLEPVAHELDRLLKHKVTFADNCVGREVEKIVKQAKAGGCILCENLRFHKEEKANDRDFARKLAKLGDIYVNDAFGTAHRAHASTVGVTEFFDTCAAGYLMEKEMDVLSGILEVPERPFIALVGGIKAKSKVGAIKNLMKTVDKILIGGGIANSFFKVLGVPIGESKYDPDIKDEVAAILNSDDEIDGKVVFPVDRIVTDKIEEGREGLNVPCDDVPPDMKIVDIGRHTIDMYKATIESAMTCVISGTMGVFEIDEFATGTRELLQSMVTATENGATTVAAGGDTAAAVKKFGLEERLSHISTGGGASLALLSGDKLPAFDALTDK